MSEPTWIQRYDCRYEPDNGGEEACEDGDYVLYADHVRVVEDVKRQVWDEAKRFAHDEAVETDREIAELQQQLATAQAAYNELIMAVAKKYPGETRHQTALKYIQRAEREPRGDEQQAQQAREEKL